MGIENWGGTEKGEGEGEGAGEGEGEGAGEGEGEGAGEGEGQCTKGWLPLYIQYIALLYMRTHLFSHPTVTFLLAFSNFHFHLPFPFCIGGADYC